MAVLFKIPPFPSEIVYLWFVTFASSMKKIVLTSVVAGCLFTAAYSQNTPQGNGSGFVTTSAELKENGKHFFVVNLNGFKNDAEKAAFMELVYAENRVFPVSVANEKGLWTLSAHASVVTEEEGKRILGELRNKAIGKTPTQDSQKKLINK